MSSGEMRTPAGLTRLRPSDSRLPVQVSGPPVSLAGPPHPPIWRNDARRGLPMRAVCVKTAANGACLAAARDFAIFRV